MHKRSALIIGVMLVAFAVSACGGTPPPPPPTPTLLPLPTLPPPPTPTAPPPTATLAPSPTIPPTVAPAGSPTRAGTAPTATRTPTRAPGIAPTPAPSPTPAQAGLFVTNLRIEPDPPTRGVELQFYPTFVNNTGGAQNTRWVVFVYRTDTPSRSTGETPRTTTGIPQGASEQKTAVGWKLGGGGPCEYFFARVAFIDQQENKPVFFTQPGGKVFEKGFTICP